MNICSTCIHREVCEWFTTDESFKRCSDYLSDNLIESSELKAKICEGCEVCLNNGTLFCHNGCEIDWVLDLINEMEDNSHGK